MRPVLCLITERRRWADEAALVASVAAAAQAGVHVIQVREHDLEGRALASLVHQCVAVCRGTRTRVLVNDRLDVALAAGAHGVHLRETSMPALRIRSMTPPGFLLGRSVHSREGARQATDQGGLDYVVFGPVYPTASKPGAAAAGLDALAAVVAGTPLPVLALGGITASSAGPLGRTGAAGMAAIGFWSDCPVDHMAAAAEAFSTAFADNRR
ncbi:MAG TPA: thiamine phosphate synthase [Vicinamibacterales bacterium]